MKKDRTFLWITIGSTMAVIYLLILLAAVVSIATDLNVISTWIESGTAWDAPWLNTITRNQ